VPAATVPAVLKPTWSKRTLSALWMPMVAPDPVARVSPTIVP